MFAGCRSAVMTRTAGTDDLRVIDPVCGREGVRVVTIFANVGRLYVGWAFARGIDAIVATGTTIDDTEVIERRWSPGDA